MENQNNNSLNQGTLKPTTYLCKYCKLEISYTFYYCPYCGKKVNESPVSTGIGKQIYLYLLSFFLPPLGLLPGIKYLINKNKKAKIIGLICLVLTFISIFITFKIATSIIDMQMSALQNQMQLIESLGY